MDNINFHMVDQFFQPIISSLPKILGAIGLFILGFIIAKVIRRLTKTFLVKIKVDKLADKLDEIELFANTKIKLVISSIVAGIIYYLLLVVFTIAITELKALRNLGIKTSMQSPANFKNFILLCKSLRMNSGTPPVSSISFCSSLLKFLKSLNSIPFYIRRNFIV